MILIIFLLILSIYSTYFIFNNGWNLLLKWYKTDEIIKGIKIKYVSMGIGKAVYRNSVLLTYNPEGLYMEILGPFKRLYPPLFVPWKEIKYNKDKNPLYFNRYELIIGEPKVTTFIINDKTFTILREFIHS